ncbi:NADH dehydrogenase subunit 3 [Tolypothrix sp. PCC 7601]|nr:NADH dehydrogenase subunit 3 [Tolypothrix sp. PCC 7601]
MFSKAELLIFFKFKLFLLKKVSYSWLSLIVNYFINSYSNALLKHYLSDYSWKFSLR